MIKETDEILKDACLIIILSYIATYITLLILFVIHFIVSVDNKWNNRLICNVSTCRKTSVLLPALQVIYFLEYLLSRCKTTVTLLFPRHTDQMYL